MLDRLYEHVAWADARVADALTSRECAEAVAMFGHVLGAEEIWLARARTASGEARRVARALPGGERASRRGAGRRLPALPGGVVERRPGAGMQLYDERRSDLLDARRGHPRARGAARRLPPGQVRDAPAPGGGCPGDDRLHRAPCAGRPRRRLRVKSEEAAMGEGDTGHAGALRELGVQPPRRIPVLAARAGDRRDRARAGRRAPAGRGRRPRRRRRDPGRHGGRLRGVTPSWRPVSR